MLSELQVKCLVKDVQILTHSRVRFARARCVGLCQRRLQFAPLGELIGEGGVGDALVKLRYTFARAALGIMLELHIEQNFGVRVTALNPVFGRIGAGLLANRNNGEAGQESRRNQSMHIAS